VLTLSPFSKLGMGQHPLTSSIHPGRVSIFVSLLGTGFEGLMTPLLLCQSCVYVVKINVARMNPYRIARNDTMIRMARITAGSLIHSRVSVTRTVHKNVICNFLTAHWHSRHWPRIAGRSDFAPRQAFLPIAHVTLCVVCTHWRRAISSSFKGLIFFVFRTHHLGDCTRLLQEKFPKKSL